VAVKGWIHKFAFQDNALAADAAGRAAMEDGYLTNAKIADGVITLDKMDTTFLTALAVAGRADETKVGLSLVG